MVTPICKICNRLKDNGGTCPVVEQCKRFPKLNLGSGEMIKTEMINFDMAEFKRSHGRTDVIGRIEDITSIFPANYFVEILCAHVIEHFYLTDALKVMDDMRIILRDGGKLIIEAPDYLGCYDYYVGRLKSPEQFRDAMYGREDHRLQFGNEWTHKWAWTREEMAKTIGGKGFRVTHKGIGMTHGMGKRDLRVEAIKC
jgi:predicted SAM-dependent methyltransferase